LTIRNLRVTKRIIAAAAAAALSTTLLVLPTSPVSATASPAATVRIAGLDRYATSNLVATATHGVVAGLEDKFVLASGTSCADGLSAASLAGALGAPLLLTTGDALPATTLGLMQTMSRNKAVKYVVIVGGVNAVSKGIADQLTATGYIVSRMDGATRYATADAVAAATMLNNAGAIGTMGGYRTAFLASGTNFADALSASGYSYKNKLPVFLTDGTTLSTGTAAAMTAAGVQQVIVLGGVNAVSDAVLTAAGLVTGVLTTQRIGGADRYETATLLATAIGVDTAAFKQASVLVNGTECPDALVASQYAALQDAVILPTKAHTLPAPILTWLATNQATMGTIYTVGGLNAVFATTVAAAKAAATIAAPTASITANDGSTAVTVTYTAQMNAADAIVSTNFSRTTAAGVVTYPVATPVYSYVTATGVSKTTMNFATALAPGDTIRVLGNAINDAVVPNLKVASASTVVASDTTGPTAAITAFAGGIGTSAYVSTSLNAVGSFVPADLVHVPKALGATPATFTCGLITATTTYKCTSVGQVITAGDSLVIGALQLTTSATVPVVNAAPISALAVTDITPPKLLTAKYTTGALGGALASASTTGGTGILQVKARAGGVAEGKAGNLWKITTVDAVPAAAAAASVAVSAATKTVTITMDITAGTVLMEDVATVLNANAAFSAIFVANTTTAGVIALTAVASTPLTTGADAISIVATFSEPLSAAVIGDFTFTGFTVANPTIKASVGTDDGRLIGVLTLVGTSGDTILPGIDTVKAATGILDLNGVAVTGTDLARTVPMIAG
jgi:putative cell wall-binding protein